MRIFPLSFHSFNILSQRHLHPSLPGFFLYPPRTCVGSCSADFIWSDLISVELRSGATLMELKVWVDGVVRVVCGLSEETSCQDVVIALAQAIGAFVRYTT